MMDDFRIKQIEILDAVHEACEKLGIKYSLASGTLIGAVRHKGYIPWDDDIDIMMRRDDYDIFMEKAQEILPDYMFVQNYQTDPMFPKYFGKVRNSNTTHLEKFFEGLNMNMGIAIDIFPVDRMGDSNFSQKYSLFRRRLYFSMCTLKCYLRCNGLLRKIRYVLAQPVMIFVSLKSLARSYEKYARKTHYKYKNLTSANHLTKNCPMPFDIFNEYELIDFEGKQYYTIKNYDLYLTKLFGDYMTPPPVGERGQHFTVLVDANSPYDEYLDSKFHFMENKR